MPKDDAATELVRIFPDQPVRVAEGLDFQFDGLARTLAELAWNPDNATPFTAVIRGGWGRGKTTLLRQTERLLRDAEKAEGLDVVLDAYIALLDGLTPTQRDLLVHTGSPPREAKGAAPEGKAATAQRGTLGIEWVDIPGGSFKMGSDQINGEKPVHSVTLATYSIGKYPVTNAQYAAFVAATGAPVPSHWENGRIPEGKEKHPVTHVSWNDANAYCDWLNGQTAQDGKRIRLLTEAQWEFAARGSAGREYPWGAEEPDKERCNFGGNVGDTTPVGAYPEGATLDGVHDLAGNVWDWTQDEWHDSYEGAPLDGSAWKSGAAGAVRVIRGGSWGDEAQYCRSAFRDVRPPDVRSNALGFRCARVQE